MHFMFIVPWITQQRWNGIQLHLCDALYVHCAADLRCRAAHAISCICAMHFMFIVPRSMGSELTSSSGCICAMHFMFIVPRSMGSELTSSSGCICAMHFMFIVPRNSAVQEQTDYVASVRCTLCSLCPVG